MRSSAFAFTLVPLLIMFGQDLVFVCLANSMRHFQISHSAPQTDLSSKQRYCLFGFFAFCSLVLPLGVMSLQRENTVHGDHTWGSLKPWGRADLAYQWGSAITPGKRKSRLKQNMGKEEY